MPVSDSEIQPAHLAWATVPRAESVDQVLAELTRVEERLELRVAFAEGWKLRLPTRSPAPPEASLQDLIRTARERLRDGRVARDTLELDVRKHVVGLVKGGLGS